MAPRRVHYRICDCDVHNHFKASLNDLAPYLDLGWRERMGIGKAMTAHGDARFALPPSPYGNPRGGMRRDSVPPDGSPAGSDPEFMASQLLDAHGIDFAILNLGSLIHLSGVPYPDLAAAIATAANNWMVDHWLSVDDRYLGSIHVAPQRPDLAAKEIRRAAENPRMVQVALTSPPALLGNPFMHPIYEAANEVGLPVTLHVSGDAAGISAPSQPIGFATTHIESFAVLGWSAGNHIVSMVCEGVFEKYPQLVLVLNEHGVAWLPAIIWRLDQLWRSMRDDVPWLKRRPSEYIMDHVRLTTQPLEEPDNPEFLLDLLAMIDGQELLMFASDYPHWDFDNPDLVLNHFPEDWKGRIFYDNAREVFNLRRFESAHHTEAVAQPVRSG